jgi:hypothetical protein
MPGLERAIGRHTTHYRRSSASALGRRISQRHMWFNNHAEPESQPLQLLVD